jgi:cytidylate kinase
MIRVAIDGPGGTGKSSIAKAVAEKLGLEYIDTGAM